MCIKPIHNYICSFYINYYKFTKTWSSSTQERERQAIESQDQKYDRINCNSNWYNHICVLWMTERIQCKKGASCIGPHLTIKTEHVCLPWTHPSFAPCIHLCYNGKHVVHQSVNSKALLIWLVYFPLGDIGETFKYWFCTSTSSTVTNTYSIYSHI